jgi:hypothetical protein
METRMEVERERERETEDGGGREREKEGEKNQNAFATGVRVFDRVSVLVEVIISLQKPSHSQRTLRFVKFPLKINESNRPLLDLSLSLFLSHNPSFSLSLFPSLSDFRSHFLS